MKLNVSTLLITVGFAISLFSCSDHRLGGPLSPVRLRLKTVESGTALTTYTYDSQNRPATITNTSGNKLSVYAYGNEPNFSRLYQYPNPADQTSGTAIIFPNSISGLTSFITYNYAIIQSNLALITSSELYSLETNGHVKTVSRGPGNVATNPNQFVTNIYSFSYTGENITTVGRYTFRSDDYSSVYEYDTQINPFFASTEPGLDDTQRFSRNNVTKITTTYPVATGRPVQTVAYQYEYNQQGLPTKRTTTQGGTDVVNYTYESY